ncbi:hypothetical protein SISSUDRAFT_244700 [Sistotremastrum suecicum HHB10207 ss-3]|uniref:DUF6535 domain-containing protein n=1 Tax=Sistotremastrum suecicum HHB10207 ss-3 TaxID=1314776 RepID=A0A165ZZQ8_9AGAM|nr:hypothetical protein SISSUDRAFT_244700 [Sistotremastrum suecicum HHB10207 ss-3]
MTSGSSMPHSTPPGPGDSDVSKLTAELVSLMKDFVKKQDENHKEIADILKSHSRSLATLAQQALSDERPMNPRQWDDESGWAALFKSVMSQTREVAELWKSGMDVNLVFVCTRSLLSSIKFARYYQIALFLTVVTAFLIPAIQAIDPNASEPSLAAEAACLLFYSSLIISILSAILCVLMRQWIGKLVGFPGGRTYQDRTLRHMEMKELADKWVAFLIPVLNATLIVSITLFVIGLLYQLWALSASFKSRQTIVLITGILASTLAGAVILLMILTTFDAVRHENSVFGNAISMLLRRVIRAWPQIRRFAPLSPRLAPRQIQLRYYSLISQTVDPVVLDSTCALLTGPLNKSSIGPYLRAASRVLSSDTSTRAKLTMVTQLQEIDFSEFIEEQQTNLQLVLSTGELAYTLEGLYADALRLVADYRRLYLLVRLKCLKFYRGVEVWEPGDKFEDCISRCLRTGGKKIWSPFGHPFRHALQEFAILSRTEPQERLTNILYRRADTRSNHLETRQRCSLTSC